jgi:hypothetical protein
VTEAHCCMQGGLGFILGNDGILLRFIPENVGFDA